ncbi:CubicO group peptidase (beta-lactamase class C family) [Luteibacter sp. Sphag1AF]|uniref:serine hydrolase domain-containing protein n=1 Tax=Luteibacter sp. Sphag1AF TaxID=2587031 RepID=UPI00160ACDB8|nr:serine hydrolase domain-containing protein [Luteibacter sp. Sphag1AF]MBB3227863.1 CubicO group peptidase (beta-lactamase class C family) [Luteibacter sp. Sphag1AF]
MKRPALLIIGLALSLAIMSGTAGASTPSPESVGKADAVFQRLGTAFVKDGKADAVSIAVVMNGQARFYNFGQTGQGSAAAPTKDSVYEIASITKTLSSLILAHAVLEGKIRLDDDIRQYLPGSYPNLQWEGTPVTIRDLVTTTSALPDNLPDFASVVGNAGPDKAPLLISASLQTQTKAGLLEALKTAKLIGKPGQTPRHSNVAAELVGIILEKVYGKPYPALLAQYVEKPFGMKTGTAAREDQLVPGLDANHVRMPAMTGSLILPAGGLRYSSADMAQFLKGELARGNAAVDLSQKPAWGNPDDAAVAFNWIVTTTIDGSQTLRSSGGAFGYSSYIEMMPGKNYGIVLLANRPGATQGQLADLANTAVLEIMGPPPAQIALEQALSANAFRDVAATVQKVKQSHPELNLQEAYINRWAYRLMNDKHTAEAQALFAYNVAVYPTSWNAYDSLAESYESSGNAPLAIANYKRSLEINPGNQHATDHLKRLTAPAAR